MTWDGIELPDAPMPVDRPVFELLAYAAVGEPAESLRAGKTAVEQRVSSWAGPLNRERLRLAVLHGPMALAFETIGSATCIGAMPAATTSSRCSGRWGMGTTAAGPCGAQAAG